MKIAVVGFNGAVGKELVSLSKEKRIEPILFNSNSTISFDGIDLAFFCVSNAIAKQLIPEARQKGTICIDSSSAYRNDPSVPLIIPEINVHAMQNHQGIIASPNCTTTLMLLPLAPLHKQFRIKRIVAATYQAVSGAGNQAIQELKEQSRQVLEGRSCSPKFFPHSCAFNVFPHESEMNEMGYVEEEQKMHLETQKILEDETVYVTARCIRVPVFRVHSQALNIEFAKSIDLDFAKKLMQNTPGVVLHKNPAAIDAAFQKPVFCGHLRLDHTQKNTLEMWVVGDQLLKGAALNMIQIAESLIQEGLFCLD